MRLALCVFVSEVFFFSLWAHVYRPESLGSVAECSSISHGTGISKVVKSSRNLVLSLAELSLPSGAHSVGSRPSCPVLLTARIPVDPALTGSRAHSSRARSLYP